MFTRFMALPWHEKPFALPAIIGYGLLMVIISPLFLVGACIHAGSKVLNNGTDFSRIRLDRRRL